MKDAEELRAHGRAYNEYFENWLEYQVTTPKGKKRIIRVYDGAWYTHRLNNTQRRLLKGAYVLLWLLSAVLFCLGAFQWVGSNSAGYVLVTEGISVVAWIALGYNVLLYLTSPVKMTVGQYKGSSIAVQRVSRMCAIGLCLAALATLLHALIGLFGGEAVLTEFLCALAFLAAAAAAYGLCYFEKQHVKYDITAAKAKVPEGAKKLKDRELIL